jgi:hypothetical protein
MNTAAPSVEYRFNRTPASHDCPLCGSSFQAGLGSWPFLTGTSTPVCGGPACPVGQEVLSAAPCNTLFRFWDLSPATLAAIASTAPDVGVAERLRLAALDDSLPETDRELLQLAAIDLQYCEADTTRIERLEPSLVLRTCSEAAAELLLSGCGDIA